MGNIVAFDCLNTGWKFMKRCWTTDRKLWLRLVRTSLVLQRVEAPLMVFYTETDPAKVQRKEERSMPHLCWFGKSFRQSPTGCHQVGSEKAVGSGEAAWVGDRSLLGLKVQCKSGRLYSVLYWDHSKSAIRISIKPFIVQLGNGGSNKRVQERCPMAHALCGWHCHNSNIERRGCLAVCGVEGGNGDERPKG